MSRYLTSIDTLRAGRLASTYQYAKAIGSEFVLVPEAALWPDLTGNGHVGTPSGTSVTITADGDIARVPGGAPAGTLSGTGEVTVSHHVDLDVGSTDDFFVAVRAKASTEDNCSWFGKHSSFYGSSGKGWYFYNIGGNTVLLLRDDSGNRTYASGSIGYADGDWHDWLVGINRALGKLQIYKDGSLVLNSAGSDATLSGVGDCSTTTPFLLVDSAYTSQAFQYVAFGKTAPTLDMAEELHRRAVA